MRLPELLASASKENQLRYLLIGGHAVIAHGYARTTFDVDLMIPRDQLPEWTRFVEGLGYQIDRQETAFVQFKPPPDGENLDLMLVSEPTFRGMWESALIQGIGGTEVRIPSLDHLLALKLHVLKQDLGHRVIKDLDDVIRLVLRNRIDLTSEHYRLLFEKYGTKEIRERVVNAVSGTQS